MAFAKGLFRAERRGEPCRGSGFGNCIAKDLRGAVLPERCFPSSRGLTCGVLLPLGLSLSGGWCTTRLVLVRDEAMARLGKHSRVLTWRRRGWCVAVLGKGRIVQPVMRNRVALASP